MEAAFWLDKLWGRCYNQFSGGGINTHGRNLYMMNKKYYNFGNPFKVKFREHYCYMCKSCLCIIKHSKIISKKSAEAKYYDFSAGDVEMMGDCEFIHKVFYCSNCECEIEFVTQISFEDVDIILNKIKNKLEANGKNYYIIKSYTNDKDEEIGNPNNVNHLKNMIINIYSENKKIGQYNIPILEKGSWERPYYFRLKKRELLKYINSL